MIPAAELAAMVVAGAKGESDQSHRFRDAATHEQRWIHR
jgi:hypothetical protein